MGKQKFLKSLANLSGWREAAFVLALAERALPNLQLYLEHQGGDGQHLSGLMDASWQICRKKAEESDLVTLLDQVLAPAAALAEDENYGALPSLDCLWLWEQALVSEINPESKRAQQASQRSLQTITQFLEFSEGEGMSEEDLVKLFDRHDLVKREFSFQEELVDMLRSCDSLDESILSALRELSQDEGISNIGISLT